MTEQKKYEITEAQIKRYRLESYIVPDDLKITAADEIRSRPLPAPEPEHDPRRQSIAILTSHDAFEVLEDWIIQETGKKSIPMRTLQSWLKEIHRQMTTEIENPSLCSDNCTAIQDAAQKERERVLDKLIEESYLVTDGKPRRVVNVEDIEPLRKGGEPK
jgi:hypothetical protein